MFRQAIIAGSNKAGTTSLFRYLSAHPEVCPSKIKEMNYFSTELDQGVESVAEHYLEEFDHCRNEHSCTLEASPDYLRQGKRIAERIKRALPEVKLIVMMREPANRIFSYYSSNKQNRFHENVSQVSFREYVECMCSIKDKDIDSLANDIEWNAYIQFQRGCYARHLEEFLEYFDVNQLHIVFFDDLTENTQTSVMKTADYLKIDPGFFENFPFSIENMTKQARWPAIQKYAFRLNRQLEPVMNAVPAVRAIGRKLMFKDGSATQREPADQYLLGKLRKIYLAENQRLVRLLTQAYPNLNLPSWLQ